MATNLILPLSIVLSFISYGLITKWYITPQLAKVSREDGLTPLLLLHTFRHIGMAFLIPGVTAGALDPRFANPAAYGDLLAAGLAFVAMIGLRRHWAVAVPLAWLFNVIGTVDLLYAPFQGFLHNDVGQFGATYFIPAIVVPALLVSHYLVFSLLLRRQPAKATSGIVIAETVRVSI